MASVSKENMENTTEEDDIRGDGKKKKFKPLSAVRKFFGGKSKRKKEDGVVAVKAQSTTALHSTGYDDEDDDDGGFKSHHKPAKPLVGTRSISEDSIFSPEPREQPPSFPKVAVSEESLPKSAFQSELFTKLNKRRSQYSDDDQDEGIPRSPVPVLTTADVVAEPLKPLTFGKKQTGSTRDSEQSLISVDGSDMEDDLFTTKWKTSVASKKSSDKPRMMSDSSDIENMDFSSIEQTEVLKSTAAKDRISVKPQSRRASRLSRKKKESSLSKSLPCLNEESPTRPKSEKLSMTTNNKNAMFDDIPISQLDATQSIPSQPIAVEKSSTSTKSPAGVSLSSSAPGKSQDITRIAVSSVSTQNSQNSNTSSVNVKGKDGQISPKDKEKKVAFEESSPSPSLKVSDPASDVTMSPREGYKLKRQNRSKTLPMGSAEEDNSLKIQRASSHRSPPQNNSPEETPASTPVSSSVKKLGMSRFSQFESSNTSSEPSWVNKAKQKKLDQSSSEDKEEKKPTPEDIVRRKSHENITATATSNSPEPVTSQTKTVPSSSVTSPDRKKSITDTNSNKVTNSGKMSEKDKKVDTSSSHDSSNKRPSIDITSTKRESIDIDVKEISSIKQRTASFNKTESISTNTNRASMNLQDKTKSPSTSNTSSTSAASVSTNDRAKLFSGANSSSTTTGSNSSKPPTGLGHLRSGSVKTSPTKSPDSNSSVTIRPGSVKGSTFSSSGTSSSSSSISKPDSSSSSSIKRELSSSASDKTAVTKTSNLSSSANSKFSSSNSSAFSTPVSSSSQQTSSLKTSPSSSPSTNTSTSSFSKTNMPVGRAFSSVAKPPSTTPASASNISKSNQQVTSSPSSSSTPTTSSSSTSSNSSTKSFSKTQSSPIRSHASFTTASPFRPQVSSNSPSLSSRSSALSKSTSMKVSSPSPAVVKTEDKKKEATTTPSNVPAWRANLQKATDVKIEIIEKKSSPNSSSPPTSTTQTKNENVNKFGSNSRVTEMAKKSDNTPTIETTAVTSNRSSKVLDMVKNFQNLQVST